MTGRGEKAAEAINLIEDILIGLGADPETEVTVTLKQEDWRLVLEAAWPGLGYL